LDAKKPALKDTKFETQEEHPMTILHIITLFLLSELRDLRTQKSRLKYEIKIHLYYKLHNE